MEGDHLIAACAWSVDVQPVLRHHFGDEREPGTCPDEPSLDRRGDIDLRRGDTLRLPADIRASDREQTRDQHDVASGHDGEA